MITQDKIRNIAIIAHVDHGKTTLVDAMLKQTKTFAEHQKENQETTIMDSNDLERERGVTILAKNTSVFWHDYKINILDTPGHADFSGEVERVLNMADGCILLVDAAEGVMSQTKFVLKLALELDLTPIVVINKVDKKNQRLKQVEEEVTDLFLDLATNESQLEFPILYARGIEGISGFSLSEQTDHSLTITDSADLEPLFTTIVNKVSAPEGDNTLPLQIQVNSLDWDNHLGKIVIGRVFQGTVKERMRVLLTNNQGKNEEYGIENLFVYEGLKKVKVSEVGSGEIVAISGISHPKIGDTITDPKNPQILPELSISEPTVKVQMNVNSSPFAGRDATFSTSRQLYDRLMKEIETNVGLRIIKGDSGDALTLIGRGELHLSILIETLRREGYEFSISSPQVVIKVIDGVESEPFEEILIEVPEKYTGFITTSMAKRSAQLLNMRQTRDNMRFDYLIATANLIGFRNELLTSTSGEGILNSTFAGFRPKSHHNEQFRGGAIIADQTGTTTAYALNKSWERGTMLVNSGEEVYAGMVVGINNRGEDIFFNVVKGKKLTNMRASSADQTVVIPPAKKPSLEQFLTMIADNEMLEVTPQFLRLRKKDLSHKMLKK